MSDRNGFNIENGVLTDYRANKAEVEIPDGVEKINDCVFDGRGSMITLTLPESLRKIGFRALYGCSNLKRIIMSEETLKACAPWTHIFGGTGKTVEILLKKKNGESLLTVAAFRKEYWTQRWNYADDYILPITAKEIPVYDQLVATGDCEGFKMNEQGRLKAMVLRLTDEKRPVKSDLLEMFVEFLASKFTKVIKLAEEDNNASYIKAALENGVITEANKKKIITALKKSAMPEIQALADTADTLAAKEKPASDVDKKYLDQLKKINAKAVLLKAGLTDLPSIPLAGKAENEFAPAEYIQLIFAEYISQYKNKSYAFAPLADGVAAQIDPVALSGAVIDIYNNAPSEKISLMFLPLVFRYGKGADISKICTSYKKQKWMEATINNCLMLSDTREAMLFADKNGVLDGYAKTRNTTAEYLQDTVLYDFGLDENGEKLYDLGTKKVKLTLGCDLSLVLFDVDKGKVIKSIPKKDVDPEIYAAVNADFSDVKKNVKKAAKNKIDRLFKEFLSGASIPFDKWTDIYIHNPLLRSIANIVIWNQDGKAFILDKKTPIDALGKEVSLTDAPIKPAHPMEMGDDEVSAWQKYFTAGKLKQPFAQIWEPVSKREDVTADRYKGCKIPYYRFLNQEKHGIVVSNFNFNNDISIYLSGCTATVDRLDFRRHDIDVNDNFEISSFDFRVYTRQVNHIVAYFDRVTVYERIKNDDTAIEQVLPRFTLAQIMDFIGVAAENNSTAVMALLIDYKARTFENFDPMEEFTLE